VTNRETFRWWREMVYERWQYERWTNEMWEAAMEEIDRLSKETERKEEK
jgi:hypothetical protein